jgi:hypothetical protein
MHQWVMLHRVVMLLIKAEATVNRSIDLTIPRLLHHPCHHRVFLVFKGVHIHRLGDIALVLPTGMLCLLLPLDRVPPVRHGDGRPILPCIKLHNGVVNLDRVEKGVVDFLGGRQAHASSSSCL